MYHKINTLVVGSNKTGSFQFQWIIALLVSALFCSLMPIIGKILGSKCSIYVMSFYNYFFAAVFLCFIVKPNRYVEIINRKLITIGFLYALISTVIAYLLYYLGVQKIKESSKVPIIASIETIVSVLSGMIIYAENIGCRAIIGSIMVLSSIVLMNHNLKTKKII